MSEQLPPFFYSLALKTPPDISDNQAAVHSLVLQIAIWQTFHSQRYILPTTSIHHDSNKRLLNPKQPKEPIAMRYSNTICDRINKKITGNRPVSDNQIDKPIRLSRAGLHTPSLQPGWAPARPPASGLSLTLNEHLFLSMKFFPAPANVDTLTIIPRSTFRPGSWG